MSKKKKNIREEIIKEEKELSKIQTERMIAKAEGKLEAVSDHFKPKFKFLLIILFNISISRSIILKPWPAKGCMLCKPSPKLRIFL